MSAPGAVRARLPPAAERDGEDAKRLTRRLTARRGELAAYAGLVVMALALRLVDLGERPFHHDESQDAYFSWLLAERGDYEYDPLLHGPLRFYLTGLVYLVLGDSDFTARLAPALMGTAMVALCWGLRPLTGRVAAFAVALLLAVGPSYLYFSRFAREDIYIACLTLALLVVVFRFLQDPRPWQPAAVGALLAASFATKESTFITCFVFGTFVLAWLARDRLTGRRDLVARLAAPGAPAWWWAGASFALTYLILFTTFGTDLDHWDGLWEGLAYWLGQHDVGRGGEVWFFYVVVIALEEWPALLLAGVGAVAVSRRPSPLGLFAVWAFVVSLAVYSWAGEKFAWLVLHPLLPLLVLAGIGVQAIWRTRARGLRVAGLAVVATGAVHVALASWWVNAEHRADPRELLVTTQSAESVLGVRSQVLRLAEEARAQGRVLSVLVDTAEGATFPWAWYFRDLEGLGFQDLSAPDAGTPDADVLLLTAGSRSRLLGRLTSHEERSFPFRIWWVRDYGRLTPASALAWVLRRETWNPTGAMPEWLLVRTG